MSKSPDLKTNKSLLTSIQSYLDKYSSEERASNQGINYALWLEAKISGTQYYKLILSKLEAE